MLWITSEIQSRFKYLSQNSKIFLSNCTLKSSFTNYIMFHFITAHVFINVMSRITHTNRLILFIHNAIIVFKTRDVFNFFF